MPTHAAVLALGGINTSLVFSQLLNGIALGVLYVLIATGLSVIFGLSEILNFAHGVFYALGAYLALTVVDATGSFFLAIILAPLGVAVVSGVIERLTLHRIYDRGPLYHILLTFGLVLVITDLIKYIWGAGPQLVRAPDVLVGAVDLGIIQYPLYRTFTIFAGTAIALATWGIFRYTRFGLVIRAGAQDRQTVRVLGVDISKYFTLVFALGSLLAGISGVLAAPFLGINPDMGNNILIIAFIIVVVGGLGSYMGSVIAAFVIAFLQTFTTVFVPSISQYFIFLAMFGILLVRPQGLFGGYKTRAEEAKMSFGESIKPVSLRDRRVLLIISILVVLPFAQRWLFSSYYVGLISLMFIWGLFALSLDIVMGYIGLISFGHAAFWGVGAYTVALMATHVSNSFLLVVVVAVLVTAVLAWVVGALSVRLSGVYFAMITFAVAQLIFQFALSTPDFTGGSNGMSVPAIELLGTVNMSGTIVFYYTTLLALLGCYYIAVRIMDSPFGLVLQAIRESERRASFLRYDPIKYKRRAFALSGAIGGLAGTLFAIFQLFVTPTELFWFTSGDVLFAMIFGGIGTLYGPILGGAVLVGLEHIISSYIDQWRLLIGLILISTVMFAPRGLVTVLGQIDRYLTRSGVAGVLSSGSEPEAEVNPDTDEVDRER